MLSIKKDDALFVVQRLTWSQEENWNRLLSGPLLSNVNL